MLALKTAFALYRCRHMCVTSLLEHVALWRIGMLPNRGENMARQIRTNPQAGNLSRNKAHKDRTDSNESQKGTEADIRQVGPQKGTFERQFKAQ